MILTYLVAVLSIFIANIIPVFAPPTWIILSLYKISNPELNVGILVLLGVIGSVTGRFAMYHYSKVLGKYVPQRFTGNLSQFKRAVDEKSSRLFFGSFLYSLSPLPSNYLFIGSGISGMKIIHTLTGFAFGRAISYLLLIYGFHKTFLLFGGTGTADVQVFGNILGILACVLMIFIDFQKMIGKIRNIASCIKNNNKNRLFDSGKELTSTRIITQ
ncbi:hypothetical protein [[Eubacterium] cellulosolvens]